MAEERTSNYIKLCDEWAEKFLQMEKKELMNRLPELKEEDGYLKITHFGVPFGIRLDNGRIDRLAEVAGLPLHCPGGKGIQGNQSA